MMAAGRKWVYWHRVIETFDEKNYPLGSLLGLNGKETEVAGFVEIGEGKQFHLDLKMRAKVKYLGRMLRTTTAKEVHDAFADVD
jgi:hypothetical protein